MFKRKYPKKFESIWVANYPYKSSFSLPPGKKVSWVARPNIPDQDIFNCGVSHLGFGDGGSPKSSFDKSSVFISNPNYLKIFAQVFLNGAPLSQFTEKNCYDAVTFYLSARGGNPDIVTTGSSETNPSNAQWGQDFNGSHGNTAVPNQYLWIDRAWQQILGPNKVYAGDYDGVGSASNTIAAGDIESLRPGLQSDENAWNYMSTHTPFGNPFFTQEAYKDRHGLVKTYWDGYTDPRMRITGMTIDFINSVSALRFKGSNRDVVSFPFPSVTEFRNRLQAYKRQVGGGEAITDAFCQYDTKLNTIIGAISLVHVNILSTWQDSKRFGLNPNVVIHDVRSYNGSAPRESKSYYSYTPDENVGYPGYCDLGHNAMLTGVEFYCAVANWASKNWTYCSSRPVGGNFNPVNREYIINTHKANQPVGYLFESGNRRGLLAYNLNGMPGTQTTIEWDCHGEVLPIKMTTGVLYCYLGEIGN